MPSLRRSFSSPSVRSSPYRSSSHNPSTRTRPSAPHPRRSSGSATAERRVLADIEWWRVYDGQCDLDAQDQFQEDGQALDGDVLPAGIVTLSAGGGSLEPPQPLPSFSMGSMQPDLFAVLSIAPYSPQGSRHGRDSSIESTPEIPTAPLETVQLSLADPVSCPPDLFTSSLSRVGGRHAHPLFGLRSVSAPGLSHREALAPDFADMGGDIFSFDQNLFQ